MTRRFAGSFLGAVAALVLPAHALAFHGGAHGGGGHGGGFHGGGAHGGGAHFGGSHPAGGFHPAAPAFNRTPSFSMPRSFAQPHYGAGAMNRGEFHVNRGAIPRSEPGLNRGPGFAGRGPGVNAIGLRNGNVNRSGFNRLNVNNLANRSAMGWHNRYLPYHQGWYHGYWNGHYPGGWGWRNGYRYPGYGYWGGYGRGLGYGGLGYGGLGYGGLGYGGLGYGGLGWGLGSGLGMGLGMGTGYGLSSWLFGPMLYNWGYSNYANPYYGGGGYGGTTVVQQPIIYDYSQPINAMASVPDETVTTQAMTTFEQAREAFRQADYSRALDLADQALKQVPNDPTLHEFRALDLYALGRYDEAAAALYAVLSVGPGWDWSTMIGLYSNPETYTQQLRALEGYIGQHQNSTAAHFVLAYHYLTMGHASDAAAELKTVVALQPKDTLAAQLLQQLEPSPGAAPAAQPAPEPGHPPSPTVPPASTPVATGPAPNGKEGSLQGTWTAQPAKETSITLTFQDQDHFTWKVTHQGQEHEFKGTSSFVNGILTLAQDQNNAMVGDVSWQDPNHFQFKVLGGGPSDPGLTFAKTS